MKTMLKILSSAVAISILNACASFPNAATAPRASVYKYVGSVQCKAGGIPLSAMMRQLSDAGIPVLDVSCGIDGRMHMTLCGAADGRIGVFEIAETKLSAATALGFAPLDSLPEASKTVCAKTS